MTNSSSTTQPIFKPKKNRKTKITENEHPKKTFRKRELLTLLVTFVSIIGTILTLVGYGISIAVTSAFSMPHETLFSSTFELLELSVWAIVRVINKLSELHFISIYLDGMRHIITPTMIFFVIWYVAILIFKNKSKFTRLKKYVPSSLPSMFQPMNRNDGNWLMLGKCILYAIIFTLSAPLALVLSVGVIITLIVMLPLISFFGFAAGTQHINQYVVNPTSCTPLVNAAARKATISDKNATHTDGATCIVLRKDDKELGRGRLVFATGTAVILYDPKTGGVRRIPTKDAVIDLIGSLEVLVTR